MNKRAFNRTLRELSTTAGRGTARRTLLDPAKIATTPPETLRGLVYFLLRQRAPIVEEIATASGISRELLASHGYFHRVRGTAFIFLCTAENQHRIEAGRLNHQEQAT